MNRRTFFSRLAGVVAACVAGPVVAQAAKPNGIYLRYRGCLVGPIEPVGRDTDGTIKPIDQLSYCTVEHWKIWGYRAEEGKVFITGARKES